MNVIIVICGWPLLSYSSRTTFNSSMDGNVRISNGVVDGSFSVWCNACNRLVSCCQCETCLSLPRVRQGCPREATISPILRISLRFQNRPKNRPSSDQAYQLRSLCKGRRLIQCQLYWKLNPVGGVVSSFPFLSRSVFHIRRNAKTLLDQSANAAPKAVGVEWIRPTTN